MKDVREETLWGGVSTIHLTLVPKGNAGYKYAEVWIDCGRHAGADEDRREERRLHNDAFDRFGKEPEDQSERFRRQARFERKDRQELEGS